VLSPFEPWVGDESVAVCPREEVLDSMVLTHDIEMPDRLDGPAVIRLSRQVAALSRAEPGVIVLRVEPSVSLEADPPPSSAWVSDDSDDAAAAVRRAYVRLLAVLRDHPWPTLAVVEGLVQGGVLGLVASCDVVLASSTAVFDAPRTTAGLAWWSYFPALNRRVRTSVLRRWERAATAHDAVWAASAGLIDEAITGPAVSAASARWVRLLTAMSPEALVELRASREQPPPSVAQAEKLPQAAPEAVVRRLRLLRALPSTEGEAPPDSGPIGKASG
jgi:enoyl-CoA hydratase/carnithine racemase